MQFKFNSGMGALLCETCGVIIVTGHKITTDISDEKYYFCCEECRDKFIQKHGNVNTEVIKKK